MGFNSGFKGLKRLALSCLLEIEKARNSFNSQLHFVLSSGERNDLLVRLFITVEFRDFKSPFMYF